MFKQNTDVFLVNDLIGNNLTDLIVEGDVYVPDNTLGIEKIINTTGKVKIANVSALTNKVAVYGDLNYTIIYRGNNENSTTSALNGKIDFMEEIPMQGVTEEMSVSITPSIDYIDSKIVSDYKGLIKAVVNIETEVINNHNVNYISNIESDGSFQAKTDNFTYTDVSECISSELPLNVTMTLEDNMNEIEEILKFDVMPIITETDIMNERMLIEGICKVGILYSENDEMKSLNYLAKDFPFTHYVELKNANELMKNSVAVSVTDMNCEIAKDDNDENKITNCEINMEFTICLYEPVYNNMISDAYSTTNEISIDKSNISVNSLVDFCCIKDDFEKTFDVDDVSIKDIYYYDAVAKISEKTIYDDNMVVDGFIDVNVIFLDGDINKVDSTSTSIPFSSNVDLSSYTDVSDAESKITLTDVGVYRKGRNTIVFEAKIVNDVKVKNNKNVSIISNIVEGDKLNKKNTPSIVFRVVQPNECLWDIAKNYNISMNYLCQSNNLDIDSELTVGEKIIITKQI
ncbi:DUF3794 domain-containing protein [Sedimentibacter sp. zth1]|uniref:DUF3794 and LysM peptidoglycan-binding domain-containing protein n=1 Tax=Sedimentibacter sp. zth1 TaxID=2816908 RepID=UPI001A93904D|nr:SPOCS domain-containing protein [Sedimentibacter sp. zth1]QSX04967.1 DUF3794 domain-containing protein [Sedimentibacter sp. zth1]